MIYAILGALVIGLSLGLFGSGGSILTIPVLIYLLDHPDKVAIAESLAIVGSIAFVGSIPYALAGHVKWRIAFVFGLPGMLGTYLGAWISSYVAGYVQLIVFACVMLLAARSMWIRSGRKSNKKLEPPTEPHRSTLKVGTDGLGVGILTGFVGVGGGFLIVPALVLLGGLHIRRAVATSLAVITLTSASGFWKHLHVLEESGLHVNWRIIGIIVTIGVVGSFGGRILNSKINQHALQRGFAVFLVIMALFILVKESATRLGHSTQNTSTQLPEGDPQ